MEIKARDVVLAPLPAEGTVERIVRRLGEAIGSGLIAPGERLPPEAELAAQFSVATMTLRQALAVLRDAGFVETRRGRGGGTFVRDDPWAALAELSNAPTAAALRDLTDWRRAVSGEAAALAAERASAADAEALDAQAGATEALVGDAGEFRRADARFHVSIAEVAGSRRLIEAEAQVQAELAGVLRLTPGPARARHASQAGHGPIVEAIAHRDPEAARAAMIAHVEATHDWVVGLRLGRLVAGGRAPATRARRPRS
jgi:DNA-binding FadR family transcriptional regulator